MFSTYLSIIHWVNSNSLQVKVTTTVWVCSTMFHLFSKLCSLLIQVKKKIAYLCFISQRQYPCFTLLHLRLKDMCLLLLSWEAAIIPLNSAPGPSSIFYGAEYVCLKMQQSLLADADAKYLLQWFCATLISCPWLLNECWMGMRKTYLLIQISLLHAWPGDCI